VCRRTRVSVTYTRTPSCGQGHDLASTFWHWDKKEPFSLGSQALLNWAQARWGTQRWGTQRWGHWSAETEMGSGPGLAGSRREMQTRWVGSAGREGPGNNLSDVCHAGSEFCSAHPLPLPPKSPSVSTLYTWLGQVSEAWGGQVIDPKDLRSQSWLVARVSPESPPAPSVFPPCSSAGVLGGTSLSKLSAPLASLARKHGGEGASIPASGGRKGST
jgi:hypothetical protein